MVHCRKVLILLNLGLAAPGYCGPVVGAVAFFLAPLHARSAGTGQAGEMAHLWDGGSISNPALVAWAPTFGDGTPAQRGTEGRQFFCLDAKLSGSMAESIWGDMGVIAYGYRGSAVSVGLSIARWETDGIPVRDETGFSGVDSVTTAGESVMDIAVAHDFSRTRIGLVVRVPHRNIGTMGRQSGVFFGLGMAYDLPRYRAGAAQVEPVLGLTVQNLPLRNRLEREDGDVDRLSKVYGAGATVAITPHTARSRHALRVSLDVLRVEEPYRRDLKANVGTEWVVPVSAVTMAFRAGIESIGEVDEQRFAYGLGLEFGPVAFDYARVGDSLIVGDWEPILGARYLIGLRIALP